MLIVFSNPLALHDETNIVNQLFDNGLEVFHLRKPDYTASRTKNFMSKIKSEYWSRVALHQNHQVAAEFNTFRLHFSEEERKYKTQDHFVRLRSLGFILSTSIHKTKDYSSVSNLFDYTFLSPIFDSISKHNYRSILTPDFSLPLARQAKIIALGGIDKNKVEYAYELGFDGVGVLGAIWQNTEKSLQKFKDLKIKCSARGQLY